MGGQSVVCYGQLRNKWFNFHSNTTSFIRFVNKRAIYRLGIISLAHALVHVTDFQVVNVDVDELSSAWIWQHKLCATLSANVNINYRLPIKVCYRDCTLRNIRIEIIHGSQNMFLNLPTGDVWRVWKRDQRLATCHWWTITFYQDYLPIDHHS
jgi:hypothetical protein